MAPSTHDRDVTASRERPTRAASRRTVLQTAGASVGGLALGTALSGSAAGAVDNPTPRLHTEGNWLRDPDGNPVKLRGFATASLDFLDNDWYQRSTEEILTEATDGDEWHPNAIRLPVGEDVVHSEGMDYVVEELLRPAVDLLAERGVYAVIDFHLIRPYIDTMGNAEGMVEDGWADSLDGLGFDPNVATDDLLTEFWEAVAPAFADDEHVLYELFNEPTLPVAWSTYGEYGDEVSSREDEWLLWRDQAQSWVDTIRDAAPETPILIGSPDWTSRTRFAPEYPFEGENLVYAAHIYPPNGLPFQEYEHDGSTVEPFEDEYHAPTQDVPVVVTEFGWDPDEPEDSEGHGETSTWGEPMRDWLETEAESAGWLAWCYDDTWAPTFFDSPTDDHNTPWELKTGEDESGWFVKEWLAETADDRIPSGSESDDDCQDFGSFEACDPDGDGLYQDFDDDGDTSTADVSEFQSNLFSDGVQDNAEQFNFSGSEDGSVSHGDVVALFQDATGL